MTRLFIIRLILSHIDHCAIKIQKKIQKIQKKKKKFAEFLCETEVCQLQGGKFHIRPRADMLFPALYPFNLMNFWKIHNLLCFLCTFMLN
jgi:hypothetical protein